MSNLLSARLREETKQAHTRAERSGIMRALIAKRIERSAYVALLRNLHPVYRALETGLEQHSADPAVQPIYHPALNRLSPLESDLVALAGPEWPTAVGQVAPALEYAARIRSAADTAPWLLAAHSYTRYLGDLSGGQILKRLIMPQLGAGGSGAIAFYEFPEIPDPEGFKRDYRRSLDQLPLSPDQQDQLVAESLAAFDLNARLFEALD